MATLERIAELSGVSRSTVSRVVNNDPNVRESTRTKVLRIMAQEHYQPNMAARGLASGKTDVIGLVIPVGLSVVFTDPFYPLLMQGIADGSRNRDRFVMLWLAEPEYERQTIEQVVGRSVVDGVIVAASAPEDPLVDSLVAAGKPFVMIGRHPTRTDVSFVDIGNREAARDVTKHLLRLGARRIATIAGPPQMIAGLERLAGYREALESAGVAPDPGLIVTGDFTARSGASAMTQLLEQRPEAVFAANDAMAIAAIRTIRRAGLRVPEDIAVAGFDDIPGADEIDPPLTTVRQPIRRLGSTAAATLIELIADPGKRIREVILPTELVVRRSCGSGFNREKEN
jgi:LacI family transcriptional regulator